jgi:hypothetical protein
MSGMKSYGLDLEDMVVSALENDAKTVEDVISYCRAEFVFVDEEYVSKLYIEFCGE